MTDNPLKRLEALGQSVWIDYIRRAMITSGQLSRLIDEDGISGITSNPSIFEKAIAGSRDYEADIKSLAFQGKRPEEIYRTLAVRDLQMAADLLRPVFDSTRGDDGYVSMEVSPLLAYDTAATMAEARELWKAVNRPNLFIKVPATREGVPAIEGLIAEGINVNVTLLFGLARYREVAEAFVSGLEKLRAGGKPIDMTVSVASFFLSRIDTLVDGTLEKKGGLSELKGQAAVASAKAAYEIFKEVFGSARFAALAGAGARPQKLLWASTSTKNPAYSDVKYVEALIAPKTINTMTLETIDAYRGHGNPAPRLEENVEEARRMLALLEKNGIHMQSVSQTLEDEGVEKFRVAFTQLISSISRRAESAIHEGVDRQAVSLGAYGDAVRSRVEEFESSQLGRRLWQKDPSLWTSNKVAAEQIRTHMDWLFVAEKMEESAQDIQEEAAALKGVFSRAVLLGMGGSSLTPLFFRRTFAGRAAGAGGVGAAGGAAGGMTGGAAGGMTGGAAGSTAGGAAGDGLPLTVLDTTDPAAILEAEKQGAVEDTLFIVSSKSGTTAEPLALMEYFFQKVKEKKGPKAGENFISITDPGTPLEAAAGTRGFRRIYPGFPGVGGRYSALSPFGIVPAAVIGMDIRELLALSMRMRHACDSSVPATDNPGLTLGAALGELAKAGRDKVTFILPPAISSFGLWLEQLIAESTGKQGRGIIPIAGEPLGAPEVYGSDRVFVMFRMAGAVDEGTEKALVALREKGHPVIIIQVDSPMNVGEEFIRWEIATAAAGSVLGINPFDQPNVQEAKDITTAMLERASAGSLPDGSPTLEEGSLGYYHSGRAAGSGAQILKGFLSSVRKGDYVALLAYLHEDEGAARALGAARLAIRDGLRCATTVGFGPRYLHSTGQLHQGGPDSGLFIMITADDPVDAPIPGRSYGFSTFMRAQALGDLETLKRHGRRVMRIHLGRDQKGGLFRLIETLKGALSSS